MSTQLARIATLPSMLDDDFLGFPGSLLEDRGWNVPALFNAPFFRGSVLPAVNIKDNLKSFDLEVAVPGYKKEELKVSVDDNVLTISAGTKKETEEERKGYVRREYSSSSFRRSFTLPEHADGENVKASCSDGVLKLSIPKTKVQPTKRGKEVRIA